MSGKHLFFGGGVWEMIPALGWAKRDKWGCKHHRCLNKPLVQIGCLSLVFFFPFFSFFFFLFFFLSSFPQYTWAAMPLSCSVSKAVEADLHRKALCISNSWDTELTSSLIDLQGDACCADMLECMSPLPPSALCRHILNDHVAGVYSATVQQCAFVRTHALAW